MVLITFEKLYSNYDTLTQAKDNVSEYLKEYRDAIDCTKGDSRTKMLATQIISKFFKHFPDLQNDAVDAIIDECQDEDANLRINAMNTLPILCKDNKENVSKIAVILAQLLQLEELREYNTASKSLLQILKSNPITVLKAIFGQINYAKRCRQRQAKVVRDKCIQFLITKVKRLEKSGMTIEVDNLIITETKRVLQHVTAEEFMSLMPFLISTRLSLTFTGQQEIINIAVEKAGLDKEFISYGKESKDVHRVMICIKVVLPLFSVNVESTKFVVFICDQILPQWEKIAILKNGNLIQMVILRQLAELSLHCGKLDNPSLHVAQVYQKLKDYMPPPPEDTDVIAMPSLDFTAVECLLYTFHRLARQCPHFLTHDPQILRDFRARLTYFSRGAQGCTKALNSRLLKNKSLTDKNLEKRKMAPKLLKNINLLIKDLLCQPSKYRCAVTLSFKLQEPKRYSGTRSYGRSKRGGRGGRGAGDIN